MLLELLNRVLLKIFEFFEDLNNDNYPEDYIEIENKNGKKELIKYGI